MEKDKYVGICKVGEKGQIVIPVEARKIFDIKPGDSIIVLCERKRDCPCKVRYNRRFSR